MPIAYLTVASPCDQSDGNRDSDWQCGAADQARLVDRLNRLPRAELLAMYDAAAEAIDCMRTLADSGTNPVTEVLQAAPTSSRNGRTFRPAT